MIVTFKILCLHISWSFKEQLTEIYVGMNGKTVEFEVIDCYVAGEVFEWGKQKEIRLLKCMFHTGIFFSFNILELKNFKKNISILKCQFMVVNAKQRIPINKTWVLTLTFPSVMLYTTHFCGVFLCCFILFVCFLVILRMKS